MKVVLGKDFDEEIKSGIVLVDFFAEWCGPCKMLGPVLEEISQEKTDIKFIKVDVDEAMDIADRYSIMSIPAVFLFRDGQLIGKTGGYQGKNTLIAWIEKNLN